MFFSWRAIALATLLTGSGWLGVAPALAQDETEKAASQEQENAQPAAAEEQPAAKEEQPAVSESQPAATDPSATAPQKDLPKLSPEEAAQARQTYEQKLAQWQDLLKKLREIKVKYQVADNSETAALQAEWDNLVAQGNQMIPELRDAALKAYLAAPGEDRALVRFVSKFAEDAWNSDDFETALELSEALMAGGSQEPVLPNVAGGAAFATHQFDKAEAYFQQARDANALAGEAASFAESVNEYKELWAKEQQIRDQEAQADDLPRVRLTTNKGEIVVELFENEAPNTVANFITLVEQGFYDGLTFHRVLPHFMAQGGDPNGDGSGGPGYEIPDEHRQENARMHFRGSLSMAKTAQPDTAGSQFFLTFLPTPHLNGKHTVFGRVIEGMDLLSKLQRRNPEEASPPEPDKIIKAEVLRKRDHEYTVKKVGE